MIKTEEESNIDLFDTFCGANERKKLMDKKYLVEMKTTMHHIKNKIDDDIIDLYKYDIERGYDSRGILGTKSDIIKMYKMFFSTNTNSNDFKNNRTYNSFFKQKRKISKNNAFNTYSNMFRKNKKVIDTKKVINYNDKENLKKNLIKSFNRTNNFILRNENNSLLDRNKKTNKNFFSTNYAFKKEKNSNNKQQSLKENTETIPINNNNSNLFNLTGNSEKKNIFINKKIFDYSYKPKLIQKLVSVNDASDNFIQNLENQKLKDIKYKKFFIRQFIASKWKLISEDEKVMRSPNNNLGNNNKSSTPFGKSFRSRLSKTSNDSNSTKRFSNYKDYLEFVDLSLDKIRKRVKKENEFGKNIDDIFHENDMVLYQYKKIDKRLHNNYKKFK